MTGASENAPRRLATTGRLDADLSVSCSTHCTSCGCAAPEPEMLQVHNTGPRATLMAAGIVGILRVLQDAVPQVVARLNSPSLLNPRPLSESAFQPLLNIP